MPNDAHGTRALALALARNRRAGIATRNAKHFYTGAYAACRPLCIASTISANGHPVNGTVFSACHFQEKIKAGDRQNQLAAIAEFV
ncbi:hypothetical protein [Burkholderia pseudomallei]|uniref:hypothetical protein n=1 Tax=Burkholderia pseudomallei TaxID=28450 RepID=UPI000572643F|nr:hypothetical protein [Burkholderia pseudomallei]MBF3697705.1 hypothetical protein [Burkholderia pseudomallei]MBO3050026.1 hypothetical protein [Burkholderia pseudomallei]